MDLIKVKENTISNTEIFNLIKNKKFKILYNKIKNEEIINYNIYDENYIYFINYIILNNEYDNLKLILELSLKNKINIQLDIIDIEGHTILYNCIKLNYIDIITELINYNKLFIGISIIELKDKFGLSPLHLCVIFNNMEIFELLIKNNANPYNTTKDGYNVFVFCLIYKRNNIFLYLLEKNYTVNFITLNGETLLQIATIYNNYLIIDKLLETNINLNNTSSDLGLSVLHQSILLNNYELFKQLLKKNININITDLHGNSALHYILMENNMQFLKILLLYPNINFNNSNINGEIPLHLFLDLPNFDTIETFIINKLLIDSDLNIQDNQGQTCLMKIINNKLLSKLKNILIIKPLNAFIEDNNFNKITITDEILEILVESYYNQLQLHKDDLLLDWEIWCSTNEYDNIKKIMLPGKNGYEICKKKIKEIISTEQRSIPRRSNINLVLDYSIFTNICFYTGAPLDILFGLLLLNNEFKQNQLNLVLDYPLTINTELEEYYIKLGINYPFKLDFSNIEILWSYQKLFFPSYFNTKISIILKTAKYIVIPIGIETTIGSHANILFWDVYNKSIERFEPNGSNYPIGLNYNPNLLDNLLINKFNQLDKDIKYYPPYTFLPPIGFQFLENLETPKCKKIGDPNGFCAVWCIWWVYQRMLNIHNKKLNILNFADEIIKNIKFDNKSFKNIIRNFSGKITEIRDKFLKKYKIDINDWIVGNYTDELLNNLEKDIFNNL